MLSSPPLVHWRARNALKAAIREFFNARNFLEVDTPILVPCPGSEVHLNYFASSWQDYHKREHQLWLRSSPELHMKQVLAREQCDIFQIAPCFRNGGEFSQWHHPEFLMLEWYQCSGNFLGFIEQSYELLRFTQEKLASFLPAGCESLELGEGPLPKLTVSEAFLQFAGLELHDGDPELARQAKSRGIHSVNLNDDFETAFFKILLEKIEPALEEIPVVALYGYPPSQAALAQVAGLSAERFEIYVSGIELCNGFHELLDLAENRQRFRLSNAARQALGKEVPREDPGFWQALESGLPDSCGNALGLDRWLALLLRETSLERVIPFREQTYIIP